MAEQSASRKGDFLRSEFSSLVCLLSLRVKGHQVPSAESIPLGRESEGDAGHSEISLEDTESPECISTSTSGELKKRFLDRLAEVISYRKGGTHVSSTALDEKVDSISVYMARNDGFYDDDKEKLPVLLKLISDTRESSQKNCLDALWTYLVDYYKERLDQDYIPKYHKTFETLRDKFRNSSDISWEEVEAAQFNCEREDKVTMDNFLDSMGLASQELRDLSTLCKGGYNPELRCLIASKAFEMRHSRPVKAYIQVCFGEADSRQFLSCIYFLGRIRAAYETFVACAKANPSFQSIQAYLVLSPEIPKPNPESAPTLAQTMELAGLDCSSFVIRNHISATMQWRALEDKFRNRQQDALANLRVHCETQILQTIQQDTEDLSDVFPYFGCSKRSCYLCTLVFEEYGFTTRGTHGKIYERWMVLGESSTTDYALPRPRLVSIMKAIQTKIIEILQTPLCPTKPPIAEYSAGYTVESTMDHPRDDRIENQRSLELFKTTYISTEAGKLEQLFRKLNGNHTASQESVEECPAEESLTDQPPELSDVPTASESGDCKICHQNTAQKCAFCHNIWICGDRCRREAMVNHIFECSPGRPLDSADYLAKYCLEMQLPDDIDTSTCDDFGFSKVYTRGEKSQLLLLYIYLMDSTLLKWDSRILHKWQRENRLAEMLKKICVPILQLDRMRVCVPTLKLDLLKECCSWFLQNQHVVDANSPPLEHSAVLFEGFRRAWRQIGLEDASDDAILSAVAVDFPKVKGTAFQFYTIILLGISPSPSVDLYIDFGFCACPDDDSEAYLVWVYRVLIASCSFEEFCTAFKSRQVFRLLQKYIFNAKIQRKPAPLFKGEHSPFLFYKSNIFDSDYQKRTIPHLQAVLEKSSTDCDAVWRLKQFILSDECLPRNTVITKYGFFNCRDALERLELKRVYNQLLMGKGAVDPMDLQSACANNSLYEFASAVISLDPKFKRLMRNSKYVLIRVKDTKEVGEALNCLANASRDTQSITKEVEEALISLANASRDAQSVHTKEAEDALSSLANASRDAQSVPQGSLEEGMRRRHKFAMPDAN